MELLRQHELFGGGLVTIDSPELVRRYNECLAGIGIPPTALTEFRLDGRGWSPEIAEEKKADNYLSHGGAVQFAIILTPAQRGKPVYRPFYSFERALLADLFQRQENAIARITRDAGIWVQIDPGISTIEQLTDLAMFNSVTVSLSDTKGLAQAAVGQRDLIKRFVSEPHSWLNQTLRQAIIASGKSYGDLRFPQSFKDSFVFEEVRCYYTPNFGGVFVFRGDSKDKGLIVVSKKTGEEGGDGTGCRISDHEDRGLLARLGSLDLVEIPLEWYRDNLAALQELRENILASTVFQAGGEGIDFLGLTEAQRERLIVRHRGDLPPEFQQLERLEKRIMHGDEISVERLPLKLRWLLARPKTGLSAATAEVVWKLICRLAPVPVTKMFAFDKEVFFTAFGEWPEARQRWAVNALLTSGLAPRRHV